MKLREALIPFLTRTAWLALAGLMFSMSAWSQNPYSFTGANQHSSESPYDPPSTPPQNPRMSGEDAFIRESRERMEKLRQENQRMIQSDQRMMERGYDPNENFETYEQRRQLEPVPLPNPEGAQQGAP
jgi:hypothetical protein